MMRAADTQDRPRDPEEPAPVGPGDALECIVLSGCPTRIGGWCCLQHWIPSSQMGAGTFTFFDTDFTMVVPRQSSSRDLFLTGVSVHWRSFAGCILAGSVAPSPASAVGGGQRIQAEFRARLQKRLRSGCQALTVHEHVMRCASLAQAISRPGPVAMAARLDPDLPWGVAFEALWRWMF